MRQSNLEEYIKTIVSDENDKRNEKNENKKIEEDRETLPDTLLQSTFDAMARGRKQSAFFQKCLLDPKEPCCPIHDPFMKRVNSDDQHCPYCAIANPKTTY